MFKPKFHPMQEVILPDFSDDDNTTTTTNTKSRRVSFGTNHIKEFIVGSAVSAQCVSEYEQAFSSSDSSIPNSSQSAVESSSLNQKTFTIDENFVNPKILQPIAIPEQNVLDNLAKIPKFSSTICFSADSPTADMEFTGGCINLAKSILEKKNKEMTVIIHSKPKVPKDEAQGKDDTKYFEGTQFDMSMTHCFKSKEFRKEEQRFMEGEKTKNFTESENDMSITRCSNLLRNRQSNIVSYDDSDLSSDDSCKENKIPLNMIMQHLDRDSDGEDSLFNPEKSLNDFLNANPFNNSTESEKFNMNESMDITRDNSYKQAFPSISDKFPAEPSAMIYNKVQDQDQTITNCNIVLTDIMKSSEQTDAEESDMSIADSHICGPVIADEDQEMPMETSHIMDEEQPVGSQNSDIFEGPQKSKIIDCVTPPQPVICHKFADEYKEMQLGVTKTGHEIKEDVSSQNVMKTTNQLLERTKVIECDMSIIGTEECNQIEQNEEKLSVTKVLDESKPVENELVQEEVMPNEEEIDVTPKSNMLINSFNMSISASPNSHAIQAENRGMVDAVLVLSENEHEKKALNVSISKYNVKEIVKSPETNKVQDCEMEIPETHVCPLNVEHNSPAQMEGIETVDNVQFEKDALKPASAEHIEEMEVDKCTPETAVELVEHELSNCSDSNIVHSSKHLDRPEKTPEKSEVSETEEINSSLCVNEMVEKIPAEVIEEPEACEREPSSENFDKNSKPSNISEFVQLEKSLTPQKHHGETPIMETSNLSCRSEENIHVPAVEEEMDHVNNINKSVSELETSHFGETEQERDKTKEEILKLDETVPEQIEVDKKESSEEEVPILTDEEETQSPLVDGKVFENLKKQSAEPGCVWTVKEAKYRRSKKVGEWSFVFRLMESTSTLKFRLEVVEDDDDDMDTCSIVKESELNLDEIEKPVRNEYIETLQFGNEKLKIYLEEEKKMMKTVMNVPYFLDQMNSFAIKLNSCLEQVYSVLTKYPGSRLNGSRLTFRLFSFPIFFSTNVTIDLTDLCRLSKSSLTYETDFGSLDEKAIGDIFEKCLRSERSLCEFVIQSNKYLIDIEREMGCLSRRTHIQLLPRDYV
ncbi:hypothetical protein RUM43_010548 [Polyplax serrata]|uniref:Uncharacterized protein n=1 Tax=Polyplax serrata TaxID=468196 RepID=A0AAN8P7G4_POLSC